MEGGDGLTANSGPWSLGTVVGWPLAIVGTVVLAVAIYLSLRLTRSDDDDARFLGWVGVGLGAPGLILALFFTVWGEYPYNSEYHQWRTTSGTVTQVGSRLLGSSKSTTQRFVVTIAGVGQRSCDDTRCAEVKAGDHLTLTCKRAWQYAGSDGYDCNFVEDEQR